MSNNTVLSLFFIIILIICTIFLCNMGCNYDEPSTGIQPINIVNTINGTHGQSHENDGGDEIVVGGLSGELANRQLSKCGNSTLGWTDSKLLQGDGVGNSPIEIDLPSSVTIATGSYVGNGAETRQIAVGFKCSLVVVYESALTKSGFVIPNIAFDEDATNRSADIELHATDGFSVLGVANVYNDSGKTYYYWAISE